MTSLARALRSLRRSPWFVLGAAATFALGVGINAAVFASVDRLLFRRLPYPHAERLFVMQQVDLTTGQRSSFLPARYVTEARAQLDVIEEMAILGDSSGWFEAPDSAGQEVRVSFVTGRMLDVAGVRPVLGRGFTAEDDRLGRQVVLLTYEAWQGRFRADPDILRRRLWQRDRALDVIGVLPPGYIPSGSVLDPNVAGLALMEMPNIDFGPAILTLAPTIRLRAGASQGMAQAMLDAMVDRLKPEVPAPEGGPTAIRLIPLRDSMFGRSYTYLWLVTGAAALVLFVTCANLAALFLVRGRSRLQHAAIRLSLGASRASLIGDAMAEGLVVCLAGTAAALVVLRWTMHSLEAALPPLFARYSAGVDGRVVAFALATAALACLMASLLPAAMLLRRHDTWRVMQGAPNLRERSSPRRGDWILAIEAAIGVVLVAGAAVTARNLTALTSVELGFDPADLHLALVRSEAATPAARDADVRDALRIIRNNSSVRSAAATTMISVLRTGTAPLYSGGPPCCRWQITGDYIETIGIPLLAGRTITDLDGQTHAPVALMNEAAAATIWPGLPPVDALGRTLTFDGEPARAVIGIVGNTRRGFDDDELPAIFEPLSSDVSQQFQQLLIVARTAGAPLLYNVVRPSLDTSSRTVFYVRAMQPMYTRILDAPRFRALLFGAFGLVALVIAMVGLYALTSVDVASRRRELGVRVALGAQRPALLRMVLLDSAKPVGLGISAGLGASFWAGSFLQAFVPYFNARDPWMLALAAVALLLSGVIAAWMPASRAAGVDPVEVLKSP